MTVSVATTVPVGSAQVWGALERIEDHVTWMLDATAIRFVGPQRRGVGTAFECDTRFGPLRLTDHMEITEWDPGVAMGVRHDGAVSGVGRFLLTAAPGEATRIEWRESLSFPWWLGARLGEVVAKPILAIVWRGNLRRLARRITEEGP
jgi:hypothetical protein